MESLLAALEAKKLARLMAEPEYNPLYDYPAYPYQHSDDQLDDQDEWLNNYIEPGVQTYDNAYRQFDTPQYAPHSRCELQPTYDLKSI